MPHQTTVQNEKDAKAAQRARQQTQPGLQPGEWDTLTPASHTYTADAISPRQVIALQGMVGNQAVQRILAPPASGEPDPLHATQPSAVQPMGTIYGASQPLQRRPAPKISGFASSAGATQIQRQTILASKPGHIHQIKGALSNDPKKKLREIKKAKRTQKYNRFDDIEIDDDQTKHITDGTGKVVWYQIAGKTDQYVLAEKVLTSFNAKPTDKESDDADPDDETVSKSDLVDSTGEVINEVDNAMVDVLRGYTVTEEDRDLTSSETTTQTETTIAEGAFWAGGGAMGMVSGILGMASSLKDLTNDKKSTWEKVEAAFNLLASGADIQAGAQGISGGVATLVNSYSDEDTKQYDDSSSISSWAFGFQGMWSSLSSGIKTILDVVSLIRMIVLQATDKETFDRDEWLAKAGSLLNNALETAKGVITTFRTIWEIINDAVTTAFEAVLPGFDIAIAAVKSLFQGYYLAKSA